MRVAVLHFVQRCNEQDGATRRAAPQRPQNAFPNDAVLEANLDDTFWRWQVLLGLVEGLPRPEYSNGNLHRARRWDCASQRFAVCRGLLTPALRTLFTSTFTFGLTGPTFGCTLGMTIRAGGLCLCVCSICRPFTRRDPTPLSTPQRGRGGRVRGRRLVSTRRVGPWP